MKRNLWIVAGFLALALASCTMRERAQIRGDDAFPGSLPAIEGSYSVNGLDPLGTEYGGNLTITSGDAAGHYRLQWIITGSIQEGEGHVSGNQLIVEWRTVEGMGPGASGVTTYTVTTLRELYGSRQADGQPKLGRENAFPNDYE